MMREQRLISVESGSAVAPVLVQDAPKPPGEPHATAKLTTQVADRLQFADLAAPGAAYVIVWDEKLPGFGLRIMRSGVRAWVAQYRNRDGRKRRITIGRYGVLTAQEARDRAHRILVQVLDGVDPLADRQARREAPTVNDLLDRYLAEHVAKKNKRTTRASVEQLVARFIRPALGGHKIAAITRDDLARLHGAMSDTPRQANFALAVCSKAFNLAERWGWRSVGAGNPCRLIERYDEAERDRFLSVEELGHLGAALRVAESEGLPWKLGPARPTSKHLPRSERQRTRVAGVIIAAIELLLFTGLRRGEALGLRWANVDLAAGTIALPDTKAGRPQIVVINTPARQVLEALWRQREGSPWVLRSSASPKRPLAAEVLQNAWERIRTAAGLDDVRVHDLRHTVGTHASLTGANAFGIRDLLRHQDIAMTGRYVNWDDGALRVLSDAVGERIASGLGRQICLPEPSANLQKVDPAK